MKLVKTIALGALLIGAFNVNAQTEIKRNTEPKRVATVKTMEISPEQSGEARAKQLAERVSISDEQFSKVKELFTNIELKNKGVSDNSNISAEQKREIIQSNNDYEKSALEQILTPEQSKKLNTAPASTTNSVNK